jgi:hypothetical protein
LKLKQKHRGSFLSNVRQLTIQRERERERERERKRKKERESKNNSGEKNMFLVTTSSDVEKDSCLMSDIFRLTLNNGFL